MRPTPLRPRTDIGGGRRVPQLRSCRNVPKTAILARGPRAPVQRTPLFPPHCTARSASRWRGSSRVLFGAAVGAKTPNSGGTEQHRSTIALAGSLRPKKASVEAHQAAGDQSTSYNSSSSHHSNVSLSQIDQKLLSGRSHLSSSAAHGLLRMLPFLGCGSNETSILDLTKDF